VATNISMTGQIPAIFTTGWWALLQGRNAVSLVFRCLDGRPRYSRLNIIFSSSAFLEFLASHENPQILLLSIGWMLAENLDL